MGNVEDAEHYGPYICLLRWLLKAGGPFISEGPLLELLQCSELALTLLSKVRTTFSLSLTGNDDPS